MSLQHIHVHFDFYNKTFSANVNQKIMLWDSEEDFLETTNYPFTEYTGLLSYEPLRNIFVLEKVGGEVSIGEDLPEIQWIIENIGLFETLAIERESRNQFVVTLEMGRIQRFFDTEWMMQRHEEETILGIPHKLSDEQYTALLVYRQALRDITNVYPKDTPENEVVWPVNPLTQ